MSVNEVPGWLVTIPPRGIGVPVAFTPGLVPHCDVRTVAGPVLAAAAGEGDVPAADVLLLHPASMPSPIAAASATVVRGSSARLCNLTCPHLLVVTALNPPGRAG